MIRCRWSAVAVLLFAFGAQAEQSTFNLHLEPGIGPSFNQSNWISGAQLNFDTTFFELGPVAPEIALYGLSSANRTASSTSASTSSASSSRKRRR